MNKYFLNLLFKEGNANPSMKQKDVSRFNGETNFGMVPITVGVKLKIFTGGPIKLKKKLTTIPTFCKPQEC